MPNHLSMDDRCFVRSTRCSSSRNCIEVAVGEDAVLVRDSNDPGTVLAFGPGVWMVFVGDLKVRNLN